MTSKTDESEKMDEIAESAEHSGLVNVVTREDGYVDIVADVDKWKECKIDLGESLDIKAEIYEDTLDGTRVCKVRIAPEGSEWLDEDLT